MRKKVIIAIMCSLALLGCKNETVNDSKPTKKLEGSVISEKHKEFTMFGIFQGKAFDSELPVFKKAEEMTNVKMVGVASKNQSDEVQAYNLMLSAGNLPDVIAYELTTDLEKLGTDGGLIPLEKLIDENAPNIKKFWEQYPEFKKDAIAADGHIYMIPNYNDVKQLSLTQQYYIRKDWLNKLGLKEPTTVDELYTVLVAFRDQDPNGNGKKDEVPIFLRGNIVRKILMPLTDIFKAQVVWYVKDGVPTFGPVEENYKDAMINLSKWYKEGLIDKEIFTRGMTSRDYMLTNNLGGYTNDWPSAGTYTARMQGTIPGFDFSVTLPPAYKGNNKTFFARPNYMGAWGITTAAKDPVTIIKYFDFWYSEEGKRLWNYGIEGEDYVMVDGKPKFTDKILKDPDGRNPVGLVRQSGAQYRLGMFQDADAEKQTSGVEAVKAMELYVNNGVVSLPMPQLKYTQEELKEFLKIESQLRSVTEEMGQKWILGVSNVEKDWDSYIKRLDTLGLKRAQEIQKKAYERCMKN